jgi:hypothetical protein
VLRPRHLRVRLLTLLRWIGLVAVLAATAALFGCGDEQRAHVIKPIALTTKAPPPTPQAAEQSPRSVLRSYYDEINAGAYGDAWGHLSPRLQDSQGGFGQWRDGYANTLDTQLTSLKPVDESSDSAVEWIRLVAEARNDCGNRVTQTFEGTWDLERIGGEFLATSFDISQVGGPDLSGDCTAPPTTTTSACDPNYTGACVPADASDVDCLGGSGDGPDYVGPVQVVGDDHYGLDSDGDGYACESS